MIRKLNRRFRLLPIRRKLTWILLATSSAALLLAATSFLVFDIVMLRHSVRQNLSVFARFIEENGRALLEFNFPEEAATALKALSIQPGITRAYIFDGKGAVFAGYLRKDLPEETALPPLRADGISFGNRRVSLFQTLDSGGTRIGTIYLESDLDEFNSRIGGYLGIVSVVLLASIVVAGLISVRAQRIVSDPIQALAQMARNIAEKKDYSQRAPPCEEEELRACTEAFNEMLQEVQVKDSALVSAQKDLENKVTVLQHEIDERVRTARELKTVSRKLLEASRQAGKAEVATAVLHNVGNVLNSINVSTTLIHERLRQSKSARIARLAELLLSNESELPAFFDSDQGRLVPGYLRDLSCHLLQEQQEISGELMQLRRNVDHVKDIVAMQQSHAKSAPPQEQFHAADVAENALQVTATAWRNACVEIRREYLDAGPAVGDKSRVLQILINLVQNAIESIAGANPTTRRLTVRIQSLEGAVRISVADTGAGIDPDMLTLIFTHGFTTKSDGHGFGLHASAIAAQEMGGTLQATSDGQGRGACFILKLPANKEEAAHA